MGLLNPLPPPPSADQDQAWGAPMAPPTFTHIIFTRLNRIFHSVGLSGFFNGFGLKKKV